jgi:hypothetical protein
VELSRGVFLSRGRRILRVCVQDTWTSHLITRSMSIPSEGSRSAE